MNRLIVMLLIIIGLSTFFLIDGCSSGDSARFKEAKEQTIIRQQTIYKPYDELWEKTIDWFAFHNSPIKVLDKSSGLIASDYNLSVNQGNKYLDCGKAISGQTNYEGREITTLKFENHKGNFNVLIRKLDSNSTKVTINFFAESELNQYNNNGIRVFTQKVTCYSKGILEQEIFDAISK